MQRFRMTTPAEVAKQPVATAEDVRLAADCLEYLDPAQYHDLFIRLHKLANQMQEPS